MLNIIDIAKMAGVSKSTVSRYLNGGYVSEEKKKKIKEIIDETGFVPQRQAKGLRNRKTDLIAVIVPKISTETTSLVVDGITRVLNKEKYEVIIANTNLSPEKEIEYLNIFRANQVDGIILIATQITKEHEKLFKEITVPFVIISQEVEGYSCVFHDDYRAGKYCTQLLLEKGYKKIAFVGVYKDDIAVGYNRQKGYMDALHENGKEVRTDYIKTGNFSHESGYLLTKELLELEEKPDAIFAVTDTIAFGVVCCLNENKIKIPEEIAVISIGDNRIANYMTPRLTTLHYFYVEAGEESASILLEMLYKKNKVGIKKVKLGYKLVERESI